MSSMLSRVTRSELFKGCVLAAAWMMSDVLEQIRARQNSHCAALTGHYHCRTAADQIAEDAIDRLPRIDRCERRAQGGDRFLGERGRILEDPAEEIPLLERPDDVGERVCPLAADDRELGDCIALHERDRLADHAPRFDRDEVGELGLLDPLRAQHLLDARCPGAALEEALLDHP